MVLRFSGVTAIWTVVFSTTPLFGQAPFEVREIWSTAGDPSNPFGEIGGMVESAAGVVLVSDQMTSSVYAIDPTTRRVRRLVRQGRGPGEVQTPGLMALATNGDVALWDLGQNAILVLDSTLRERGRIQLEQGIYNPKGFVVLPDGSFVLSGGTFRSAFGIHHFSADGKHLGSWLPAPETEDRAARIQLAGAPLAALPDGEVLFTRPAPHLIARLELATGGITPVAEDPNLLDPIGDDFHRKRLVDGREVITPQWYYAQSRGVFELDDGFILNVVTRRYEGNSVWEIYSSTGQLQARRTLDRAYHPYAITRGGRILASYPDPRTDESIAVLLELERPQR